jgi:hypothetical protein
MHILSHDVCHYIPSDPLTCECCIRSMAGGAGRDVAGIPVQSSL